MTSQTTHSKYDSKPNHESVRDPFLHLEDIVFYRSIVADIPFILTIAVIFYFAADLTEAIPHSVQRLDIKEATGIEMILQLPLFYFPPGIMLAFLIHRRLDDKYVIGKGFVRAIHGLLSLEKKDIQIQFIDIRGVEIDRGIYGRISNTGTLLIGTAMLGKEEMQLRKIYNPSYYRDTILARREMVLEHLQQHND